MICPTRWPHLTSNNHQVALSQQLGAQPLPFPGMDKSGAAVCEFYVRIHLNQYFETSFPPQGESQLPEGRILSLQARQRGQNYCLQGSSKYGYRNLFDLIRNIEHLIILDSPSQHWLRGLCKKGDQCEFLHEYDMSKMPECYFYSRFSE